MNKFVLFWFFFFLTQLCSAETCSCSFIYACWPRCPFFKSLEYEDKIILKEAAEQTDAMGGEGGLRRRKQVESEENA